MASVETILRRAKWTKRGIYLLAFTAFLIGLPFVSVIIPAIVASRMANGYFRERLSSAPEESSGRVRGRDVTSLRARGWRHLESLPIDMQIGKVDGRRASLKAAGIDGLISAERPLFGTLSDARYSFKVSDSESALVAKAFIDKHHLQASVRHSDGGQFVVSSNDINVINSLAKEVFPSVSHSVEREVVHGHQYLVEGAASYEEALAMFKADRENGTLVNSYVSVRDDVDGRKGSVELDGKPLAAEDLSGGEFHVGAYIISEEEVTRQSGSVKVPARVNDVDLAAFVSDSFDSSMSSDIKSEVRFADGTPEGVRRYFVATPDGRHTQLRDCSDPKVLAEDGLKAFIVLHSADDLVRFLNEGELPKGTYVGVSDKVPQAGAGQFVLELNMSDPKVRDSVTLQNALPGSVQVHLDRLGVDAASVDYSRIVEAVRREGSVTGIISRSVGGESFLGGFINGVRIDDLHDRLTDSHLVDLSPERASQWAKDAALIRSVNVELDIVKGELRITSSVGDGSSRTDVRKLNEKEVDSLSRRGAISKTEMKDLLIQLNPKYFKTYATPSGDSILVDPVEAFIKGVKPALADAVNRKSSVRSDIKVKKAETKKTKMSI